MKDIEILNTDVDKITKKIGYCKLIRNNNL